MKSNKILIEFSATIAEIINHGEQKHTTDDFFEWAAWYIEHNIIELLSGKQYLSQTGNKRYAQRIVGWQMSAHKDIAYSAEQYFQRVFEHKISNRKNLPTTPTDKLQKTIHNNCLDQDKRRQTTQTPCSLWDIFQRAGEATHSDQPLCYHYWQGEDLRKLKIHLYDVLSSANRHYAEIYRLGLYPPDFIDSINVSQARKLNQILIEAKNRSQTEGCNWRTLLPQVWTETPLKKIGTDKLSNYQDFANHDIIKCLLGVSRATLKMITYDELTDQQHSHDNRLIAEVAEQAQPDHESEFYAELELLSQRLNNSGLNQTDKALLFNIIHQRDLKPLIDQDQDQDQLFERLYRQLQQL